jgi:two-component system response regulator HydG
MNGSALQKLREYPWPGNVRELKHTMERAVIMSDSSSLAADDLHLFDRHEATRDSSFRLDDVEIQAIVRVLDKCKGNHTKAAEMLDISRTTLYAKLKKYGI